MSEQQTMASTNALKKAIRTVIRDVRIPKQLRNALADFQHIQTQVHNCKIDKMVRPKRSRNSLSKIHQAACTRSAGYGSCVPPGQPIAIDGGINASFRLNDPTDDWSVEINGHWHEHVTSEIAISLVECAMIVAELSLTKMLANRIQ